MARCPYLDYIDHGGWGNSDDEYVCKLCHNSPQHQILNHLSKAGDRTSILMNASQICFR